MSEETKKTLDLSEKIDSGSQVIDVDEMVAAGVYLGHRKSKRHSKMKPFVFTVKNNIDIIDLQKTAQNLKEALEFLQKIIKDGGKVIFIGTKTQAKNQIKELAESLNMPYVNGRWLGGFLTNFQTMLKRIEYFENLKKKKELGELEKYTKKEKIKIEKELENLEEKFGGLKGIEKLPQALFILDLKKNILAAREAKKMGIPVAAICDTNVDPGLCDFAIPANDDAVSALNYILDKIKEAVLAVKK